MDIDLNQREIDSLIKASNKDLLPEWVKLRQEYEERKHRFKDNEVYKIQDYELFYANYQLEKLTGNGSVLRRYAYKDTQAFKKFNYFMVIEDYKDRGTNIVAVVGVPINALDKFEYDYIYLREQDMIFLVDATSLTYFCTVSFKK